MLPKADGRTCTMRTKLHMGRRRSGLGHTDKVKEMSFLSILQKLHWTRNDSPSSSSDLKGDLVGGEDLRSDVRVVGLQS